MKFIHETNRHGLQMKMLEILTEFWLFSQIFYLSKSCSDTTSVNYFAKMLFTLETNIFSYDEIIASTEHSVWYNLLMELL